MLVVRPLSRLPHLPRCDVGNEKMESSVVVEPRRIGRRRPIPVARDDDRVGIHVGLRARRGRHEHDRLPVRRPRKALADLGQWAVGTHDIGNRRRTAAVGVGDDEGALPFSRAADEREASAVARPPRRRTLVGAPPFFRASRCDVGSPDFRPRRAGSIVVRDRECGVRAVGRQLHVADGSQVVQIGDLDVRTRRWWRHGCRCPRLGCRLYVAALGGAATRRRGHNPENTDRACHDHLRT